MADNFQQVVNLQKKIKEKEKGVVKKKNAFSDNNRASRKRKSLVEEIDKVYDETIEPQEQKELSQIKKPKARRDMNGFFQKLSLVFLLVIFVLLYLYFFAGKSYSKKIEDKVGSIENKGQWYSVQLANKETYYAFIQDVSSDPVVLEKVYYNYNQTSSGSAQKQEKNTSSIRLVKRGKESYGPNGTMDVIRSQIVYMEPLSSDSKILKAILDYEK